MAPTKLACEIGCMLHAGLSNYRIWWRHNYDSAILIVSETSRWFNIIKLVMHQNNSI